MLGSHYRFLSIASQGHRQKGISQIDTCLQKQLLENYLRAVPDEFIMEKEILEIFICDKILKNKETDQRKCIRSIDKSLREVEHVLLHRQVSHRPSSHAATFFALADSLRFADDFPNLLSKINSVNPALGYQRQLQ